MFNVSETTPEAALWVPGVCTASSGSRAQDQDVLYNPNGVFGGGDGLDFYSNFTHSACLYDNCFWATLTGAAIVLFPEVDPTINLLPDYSQGPCPGPDFTNCVATDRR